MKKLLLFACSFLICFSLRAQQEQDPSVKYAQSITAEDFKAHLSFLADDLLEGRETGERGQALAALYISTQFMRMGLEPGVQAHNSYFQEYQLVKNEINEASINLGKKNYKFGEDFFSFGAVLPEKVEGDWTFAGYGISDRSYDNLEGLNVTGKNVLMLAGSPREMSMEEEVNSWQKRAENLYEQGAQTVFVILKDTYFKTISRFVRKQSLTMGEESNQKAMVFISEALGNEMLRRDKTNAEKLREELKANATPADLSFKKLEMIYHADIVQDRIVPTNVLGYLEGTDKKDELLIITAHYDHIGINRRGEINNGADDDGSGTTGVLELAEAFALAAGNGHRPRRSILFMTVSGEEKGLLGSEYYADNPVFPLENTIVNLNMDMIGRIDPTYQERADSANYIYLIGSDKLSSELHEISEKTNDSYTQMTLDYKYNDENDPNRFYYRSDHYNFAKNGIPVIFYFNGTHKDYHRPTDTIDKIHFEKAAKVTRLVFYTAWELANRDERIMVDKKER